MEVSDLQAALSMGIADFRRAPLFGLFFAAFYVLGGLLIVQSLFVWEQTWMIYPVMIGFPLIGPFAAVGLYEVSRRLQDDKPLIWSDIIGVVRSQSGKELSWMAFVVLFTTIATTDLQLDASEQSPPNIVFIFSDDHTTLKVHCAICPA